MMMNRFRLREEIASAMFNASDTREPPSWGACDDGAEAAISAIEAAGLRIVPSEATTAQLYAGQRAWLADAERKSSTLYRAMVAASPIEPKEDSQ